MKADRESRQLLDSALQVAESASSRAASGVQLFNTTSWSRTELVLLPAALSVAGDRVLDTAGEPVPSQRLADGQLAILARDVPPLSSKSFQIQSGQPALGGTVKIDGSTLDNGLVRVRIDERTGAMAELIARGLSGNLVDTSKGEAVNQYLYLLGDDLKDVRSNGAVKITTGEPGPLVASLVIESDAPGCTQLRREIRLVAGMDYVECLNLVDKARLQAKSYYAKDGKESVNFAFPFQVPDGEIRLDIPLGVMVPEADQMPSACKNWFTVGRWADVSNQEGGVTWVTLDAPLVEIGALTANLLNSQTNPEVWRKHVDRTQRFYSWAMNNHWGTNYRAYQDGPTLFRYILRPHRRFDPAAASRFAIGFSQPLLPKAGSSKAAQLPLVRVEPPELLVSAFKPSDDGQGQIVRLFNASSQPRQAKLSWGTRQPKSVFLSNTSELPVQPVTNDIQVPGHGLVTLRVPFD